MKKMLLILLLLPVCLSAKVRGRVDPGYISMWVKQQADGETLRTLQMNGGRIDATVVPIEGTGWAIKTFGMGASGDGDFYGGAIGFGHYTPINDCFSVLPTLGYGYSRLQARIDETFPTQQGPVTVTGARQLITSNSFYLANDFIYTINKCWSVTFTVQYAWAKSTTKFSEGTPSIIFATPLELKGESSGWSYALAVDRKIGESLSLHVAGGYNSSLDKEKFGLEALGVKVGLSYLF